ncbi:MAG: DUF1553 domain-containing protein [Planctomycetes bacterium]|nr:DUF1553 domain-containing protein [Planctomycetota bacterium]
MSDSLVPVLHGNTMNHHGSPKYSLIGIAALVLVSSQSELAGADDAVGLFEKKIRPVLVQHCFKCHSKDTAEDGGDVRLDQKLTDIGRLIVSGDPDKSLLITALRYRNSDLQMPPSGRLPLEVISDFERWVKMGAADPRPAINDPDEPASETAAASIEAGRQFWAFQPVRKASPPQLNDDWVQSPIDAFVLRKLVDAGLRPAPRADRRTLIRRASFVLIGLPPTPEEVEDFVNDDRSDAFARLVDRLLASPSYGERWGRHWLDVMRYGDCNGGDESRPFPNAWHFRNYVIDNFNRDVPYDRMIAEHLAGDLLEFDDDAEYEPVVGTGFLAIGTKILTQLDAQKRIADLVDEQIDAFGRAMLGMTIACARCHDHKFDPIPTADYYALAGIFRSTTTLVSYGKWVERPAHTRQTWDAARRLGHKLPPLRDRLKQLTTHIEQSLSDAKSIELEAETFARGNVIVDKDNYGKGIGIIGDAGSQKNFAEFDITVPESGRYVLQLRYAAKTARPGRVLLGGKVVRDPAITEVTGDWHPAGQRWHFEGVHTLKAGVNTFRLESEPLMSHIDKLRLLQVDDNSPLEKLISEEASLTADIDELERSITPPLQVMAVQEGDIADAHILIRGNAHKQGDKVARGFLRVAHTEPQTKLPTDQSGRLHLAEWMTRPDHPLTSRVMVNRLWRWHFGRGIVSTPDNFGAKGARSTHPELLDYLARRFVENDWSIKAMHREIMLSQTWQMGQRTGAGSSDSHEDPVNFDPENTLYWQASRRRLEAEAIRDALLLVSNRLDTQSGGSPLKLKTINLSAEVLEQQQQYYDNSHRRTVYLPVLRTNVYDFLTLLDFANPDLPTGHRVTTTVPTQAMLMMNSPLVKDAASRVASIILSDPSLESNEQRLRATYLRLYSRLPTSNESAIAQQFLADYQAALESPDPQRSWTALCHTLLAGNEFVYLR